MVLYEKDDNPHIFQNFPNELFMMTEKKWRGKKKEEEKKSIDIEKSNL